MLNPVDYKTERENNIIKNIAKEIVLECSQKDLKVSQELADYMVKLKLLNPKNGFTASEVMPRSLTQQLVLIVVDDLKQDTPAINCIRMQVYWNSLNLNIADLKKEYVVQMLERGEPHLTEVLNLERDDVNNFAKLAATYIVAAQDLGSISQAVHMKETMAALHSVFKPKDQSDFCDESDEQKLETIINLSKKVTGVRLYLKSLGKAGDTLEDVKNLSNVIEACKDDLMKFSYKVTSRIDEIREVMSSVIPMDYFTAAKAETADVFLPPDCDHNDLKYLKQILVIMLQHSVYLSDINSKLEEIDGNANFYLNDFDQTIESLHSKIRDRDAVPTSEVYDDFDKTGELWSVIKSYFYCVQVVQHIIEELENINKKEHFLPTTLEKSFNGMMKIADDDLRKRSLESQKTPVPSSVVLLKDSEDFHLEFNGYCAWTLYFTYGLVAPGNQAAGFYQLRDQYYSFANKMGRELWSREPKYYLMEIYEMLRMNPEMIELLNAYEHLYNAKNIPYLAKKVGRQSTVVEKNVQTVVHLIEKNWDRNYTYNLWELKKRALALSHLMKCVTKSSQTVNHSHFRTSIGLLAAPDKDKSVQTKKDSSCVHPIISCYLYGLRGHHDDKFKALELTRPIDETCDRELFYKKSDKYRHKKSHKSASDPTKSSSSFKTKTKTKDSTCTDCCAEGYTSQGNKYDINSSDFDFTSEDYYIDSQ